MVAIIIQPSYGNVQSRRNFGNTLDAEVEFRSDQYAQTMDNTQLERLTRAHPSGRANFWAVTSNQRPNFDRVSPGDLVLFTGERHVQAAARIVEKLESTAFADAMWPPHVERGSYELIYSLEGFERVKIPYEGLRTALGRPGGGDNFMGMRIVDAPDQVQAVMELLEWSPELTSQFAEMANELSDSLSNLSPERAKNYQSTYEFESRTVIVRQIESMLREHFRVCHDGQIEESSVQMTGGGHPDLYFSLAGVQYLCEVKPSSTHSYVRTALGQILDYHFNVHSPVDAIAVLLPDRPAPRDVELFHRHNVTVIYRDGHDSYTFEGPSSENDPSEH